MKDNLSIQKDVQPDTIKKNVFDLIYFKDKNVWSFLIDYKMKYKDMFAKPKQAAKPKPDEQSETVENSKSVEDPETMSWEKLLEYVYKKLGLEWFGLKYDPRIENIEKSLLKEYKNEKTKEDRLRKWIKEEGLNRNKFLVLTRPPREEYMRMKHLRF